MTDVRSSVDGKGVAFGTMLTRMERVLRFGQATGVPVLFVRTARSINTAVFHLQSDDVAIVSPASWKAMWLKWVWFATAPFRIGSPWLWVERTVARALLGRIYERVERSQHLP